MWPPDAGTVEEIHLGLAKLFESENDPISPAGVKSQQMLESACERPNTGSGDHYKYKTLDTKLAALFHSLTKNHPFHNGNKRTALVSILTALHRNDRRLKSEVTDDDIYDFVVAVTADAFPREKHGLDVDEVVIEIAKWFKDKTTPRKITATGMRVNDFIAKCTAAGGLCKDAPKGGSIIISYQGKSIRISQATRQIDGPVVREYLNRLGLTNAPASMGRDRPSRCSGSV
ncbi:type II toxin-antitoxin system death-on-curing family toxin [Acidovorax sp. MR-S7]|uniref:type II toxin-antitoxin system death-on-curing family toxin n=1 Tax=Acidovorax sp. MR-S7 TaxID=1268622 RepID=UPI0003D3C214|nr:type II toxin-antitoxin system death-on-curing family toxin [Acidovorax sp. MR-S7]GAD22581.1 prophage maintenance system killer protein [Acidovorax sp. MR-S7]